MARSEKGPAQATQTKLYGKPLVAGLVWQPPVPKISRAAMQRQGKAAEFGLAVRHMAGAATQIGYGPKEIGEPGFHSLAAVLAKAVDKPDWIGAFRLPDTRYALVGVRQGAIMAGRDIIGTRGEVEALLRDTVQLVEDAGEKWDAIYAPKEFETPWPEAPLVSLLPRSALKSAGKLESLTGEMTRQQKNLLFGIAAGVVILGAAGWAIHAYRDRLAAQFAARSNETVQVPPPHPWKSQPRPLLQLAVWKQAMNRIPLTLAGWRADSIALDAGSATVDYRRDNGMPVAVFQAAAVAAFGQGPQVSQLGEQAQVTLPLQPAPGEEEALEPQDTALIGLTSHFQSLGLKVPSLTKGQAVLPPPPHSVPGSPRKVWAPADWQTYNWTLTTTMPPDTLLAQPFPGLRVTTMKVLFSDSAPQWSLNGVFYAKD